MTGSRGEKGRVDAPTRQLKLLATFAPGAAVVFGLLAVGSAVSALRDVVLVVEALSGTGPGSVVLAPVVGVVVSAMLAVVAGLVAYRLGVEVPRVARGWRVALAERART